MDYDLAIIGSGTAASVVAGRVRKAGQTVVMIDHRPLGGTCALRGCDPKKMLLSGAEVVDQAVRLHGHGVAGTTVSARHIVIAAGAEAAPLDIPGNALMITSEAFLNLERLPHRIVFIGGGYISAELSNIAARAGAQVTILQRGDRLLTGFDPDLVGWLTEGFVAAGIDVRLGATASSVERSGDTFRVHATGPDGDIAVEADLVVNTAGRRPALDKLDLAKGDVAVENGRLKLNEWLQSESNPAVYAAGDAASAGPPLTPVSAHDGHVVAHNLLNGNNRSPNYQGVPSAAFTLPPIAAVGPSEAGARVLGRPVTVKCEHTPGWFTVRRLAQPVSGYKTIVDPETDKILGAHLVGPAADEVINIFALAIRHDLTVADLKSTMFAYPSAASDIGSML